jgi:hypothetical protein
LKFTENLKGNLRKWKINDGYYKIDNWFTNIIGCENFEQKIVISKNSEKFEWKINFSSVLLTKVIWEKHKCQEIEVSNESFSCEIRNILGFPPSIISFPDFIIIWKNQ